MARAKKKAEQEGVTPVFADESGFFLLPGVVRTYSPAGQTPVLPDGGRKHLSVIGGLTLCGRILTRTLDRAFKSRDVVRFLKHVLSQIEGKILIIWDGASIHRSREVREFLSAGAAKRLQLVRLPAYSPDLNPIELLWGLLKQVELRNVCTRTLSELRGVLRKAIKRVRNRRKILRSFFSCLG